jgi:hypothetical protein
VVSHQLLCVDCKLDDSVKKLWVLEAIGVSPCVEDNDERNPVLESFDRDVVFENGRYTTSLPWRTGYQDTLLDNELLARKRL